MAYDEDLAARIRELIGPHPDLTEKKMSGGLAFLIRRHMGISASGQGGVVVHIDPERSDEFVATTKATGAVMQGREMPGWLRVSPEDLASDDDLSGWAEIGAGRARSLPPSSPRRRSRRSRRPLYAEAIASWRNRPGVQSCSDAARTRVRLIQGMARVTSDVPAGRSEVSQGCG